MCHCMIFCVRCVHVSLHDGLCEVCDVLCEVTACVIV